MVSALFRTAAGPPLLEPGEAFRRWAPSYGEENPLIALDELLLSPRLSSLGVDGAVAADVGCGTGRHCRRLLALGARSVVGIDPSRAMLAGAALPPPGPGAVLVCGRAESLPLCDASCDALLSVLVLAYVRDLGRAVAEIARVVRPGGRILLADLHPASEEDGWGRTFTDAAAGATFAIAHHVHAAAAYRNAFAASGLLSLRTEEPLIDDRCEEVFRRFGAMRRFKRERGKPLFLVHTLVRR